MRLRISPPLGEFARDCPCSLPASRCGKQKRQRLGHQRGLLRSLHFKRVLGLHDHLPAFPRLDPDEHDAQPHACAGRHGSQKANLVDPVIQPGGSIGRDDTDLHCERRYHRQRQITVCDRAAERTFPLRPFNVDMNPLLIAGAGGKRVNAWLVDRSPIGKTKFLSNSFAQTGKGEVAHVFVPDLFRGRVQTVTRQPYCSRNSFLLILPTLVLGIPSTKMIFSGMPYFEMMPLSANALRWSLMTVSLMPLASARLTTSASGRSPHLSSLTPMTAASATPAHCEIRSSICSDDTHSPPVLITSLIRSVMWTQPPGLTTAISLVCR